MKKIVVAKGFCTPARDAITATLAPYGVRHTVQPDPDPLQNVATVIVSDRAAAWAEYLTRGWSRAASCRTRRRRWWQLF